MKKPKYYGIVSFLCVRGQKSILTDSPSTFGKNYTRRFKDTGLFEHMFSHILQECYKYKLIDPSEVFVNVTHVKARANNKKMQKRIAQEEDLFFEDLLKKEINEDREAHGKRPLKEKDDDNNTPSGPSGGKEKRQ